MSFAVPAAPASSRRRRRWVMVLLAGIVVSLAAMWVYALFLAPKGYRLSVGDDAWVERAEGVCASYADQILALPPASDFSDVEPREEALRQRAEVLDQATGLLAEEVRALRGLGAPDNERGRLLIERWLDDWERYLGDREAQAQRWRAGVDDPITVTADESGAPITAFMDAFAAGNRMPSCEVPGDV